MLQCCRIVLFWEILDENWTVCWSTVMKEVPTVGSPFFRAFSFDCIPKALKDASVYFLIQSSNSCQLYQQIWGTFWSYHVDTQVKSLRVNILAQRRIWYEWNLQIQDNVMQFITHEEWDACAEWKQDIHTLLLVQLKSSSLWGYLSGRVTLKQIFERWAYIYIYIYIYIYMCVCVCVCVCEREREKWTELANWLM